jgi:hypothetical protein
MQNFLGLVSTGDIGGLRVNALDLAGQDAQLVVSAVPKLMTHAFERPAQG